MREKLVVLNCLEGASMLIAKATAMAENRRTVTIAIIVIRMKRLPST
jgi:hypothetical protein